MKKFIAPILILFFSLNSFAQKDFNVPKNYKFKEKSSYAKYEQDIIEATKWLINTPSDSAKSKRKKVNKFVVMWIMGSPAVTITIDEQFAMYSSSPDYLTIFMAAWASENLEKKNFKDKLAGTTAGVNAVLKYYEANKDKIGKDKKLKKYAKMKKKGKLEAFIKIQLEKLPK